jgi:hypothetical protein
VVLQGDEFIQRIEEQMADGPAQHRDAGVPGFGAQEDRFDAPCGNRAFGTTPSTQLPG